MYSIRGEQSRLLNSEIYVQISSFTEGLSEVAHIILSEKPSLLLCVCTVSPVYTDVVSIKYIKLKDINVPSRRFHLTPRNI